MIELLEYYIETELCNVFLMICSNCCHLHCALNMMIIYRISWWIIRFVLVYWPTVYPLSCTVTQAVLAEVYVCLMKIFL